LKYSLWERRTYFVKAHRSGVRPEIFINQRAKENVDTLISELKVSDPSSLPIDVEFEDWYEKELKREYERLRRDWSRRLGPDGWLRKLVDTTDAMDIISDQMLELDRIRMRCRSIYEDSTKKPGQQIAAMYPVMIAMKTQRELMGIRPIVQPDIMTEIEVVKKERRMLGDQWFDIAYMADPDGAIKLIKKMSRMDLEDFR